MQANVRVLSDETVVRDAGIFVRALGEWVDIRRATQGAEISLSAGGITRVRLNLLPAEVLVEGRVDAETLGVFGDILTAAGYKVERPAEVTL